MSEHGITELGAYIPRLRLERTAIAAAHRWMAPSLKGLAKGARAFCSWDEDAITLAVEAARDCLGPAGSAARAGVTSLTVASTTLPYADLQNSAIVAGALGLAASVRTSDVGGSQRGGLSALASALRAREEGSVVVAADRLQAKPASTQEMVYGAAAAAFSLGGSRVIARLLGAGVNLAQFVDHFRANGTDHDYFWEERWIRDEGFAKLIPPAVNAALAEAKLAIGDVDTLVLASSLKGVGAALGKQLGFTGTITDGLDDGCGYSGAAHPLLLLAAALESARPGQKILVVGFGQGAEAILLETTPAIAERNAGAAGKRRGVRGSLAAGATTSEYLRMATFYGELQPEWGMRGEKSGKAALTTQHRESHQLAGFVAGKCQACGTVQFPRLAYCVNPECNAKAAQFEDHPLTEEPAQVLTFTADWLSYHPAPPLYVGFVQFTSGARLLMEICDVAPEGIEVGTKLEAVFRIKEPDKVRGLNRYFWKMTPASGVTTTAKGAT